MSRTDAILILSTPGTSNSLKTAGIGEGELGMVAGTPSLQKMGVSETGHAALLIRAASPAGHDIYLSFYPSPAGLFARGVFLSMRTDGLHTADDVRSYYRISDLDLAPMQVYLQGLNRQIQTRSLIMRITEQMDDPATSAEARRRLHDDLTVLRREGSVDARGYDAFRHNCSTVVVECLRAGGLRIRDPWLFHTPTALQRIAEADPERFLKIGSHEEFLSLMTGRTIARPHGAFPFGAELDLSIALVVPATETLGESAISRPTAQLHPATAELIMQTNPMMARAPISAADVNLLASTQLNPDGKAELSSHPREAEEEGDDSNRGHIHP